MKDTRVVVLMLALAVVVACTSAALAQASRYAGAANPSRFQPRVDNPWFPLRPGTAYRYRGIKDGRPSHEVMTVTRATRLVDGVRCVVVRDLLYVGGHLAERTSDWYAQDATGNVWYFGESTAEFDERGRVTSTEGSWQSGRDGARAGIFMPARPRVGQSGRQEFYEGQAEDHFRVVSLRAPVNVPYTTSAAALLTEEWTPLEPGVLDHKLYVRGVGTVLERTVKGGSERNELVSVRRV